MAEPRCPTCGQPTPYMSVASLAHVAGVIPRRVLQWIDAGRLPGAYQVSKKSPWRIPIESAEAFMREREGR